jgi:hypothetical protein
MKKLELFINENWDEFSNLDSHEVCEIEIEEIDNDIVEYLKSVERFDYENVCVYYVSEKDEVWVENNNS